MTQRRDLRRRDFVKGGLGLALLPQLGWTLGASTARAARGEPHYFLHVQIAGGVDPTYMFDARSLLFTDKGKLQNYLYKNALAGQTVRSGDGAAPKELRSKNGVKALYSPLVEPLVAFRDRFTVVNGVCMLLDGSEAHGQNMYYLYNGASVKGESFVPIIGQAGGTPLESLHIGSNLARPFEGDSNEPPTNFAGSVVLQYGAGGQIGTDLRSGVSLDLDTPTMKYVLERMQAGASGAGMFSKGTQQLLAGLRKGPELGNALKNMRQSAPIGSVGESDGEAGEARPDWGDMNEHLDLVYLYLLSGATSAATIVMDGDSYLDTHDTAEAQRQVRKYSLLIAELDKLFKYLTTKEVRPGGPKLLDVTTLMITSEFGRTMVKVDGGFEGVDKTGTDHNPLNNSVILAGKGIAGGLTIGQSDYQALNEAGEAVDLPKAHAAFDPGGKKMMGRPYDFKTSQVITQLDKEFRLEEQLTIGSIVNTVFTLFGVDQQKHRNIKASDGSTIKAPVVKALKA